jgi:hypothetical protein
MASRELLLNQIAGYQAELATLVPVPYNEAEGRKSIATATTTTDRFRLTRKDKLPDKWDNNNKNIVCLKFATLTTDHLGSTCLNLDSDSQINPKRQATKAANQHRTPMFVLTR